MSADVRTSVLPVTAASLPWPVGQQTLCFGGDYNPEQWDEGIWHEDVVLMREARVNLVSVGIFAWALLEPEPGQFEFGWLDRVLGMLHDAGIRVDLGTATASPPPWLTHRHPDVLPVTADGVTLSPGARQAYCPSSPWYREAAARLVEALALRYANHPALAMWHVNNEYGCHVAHCYCETSAEAFRVWLERRYETLNNLNQAWGTSFWSQHYSAWEQIQPPRAAPTFQNPTQQLDFWRFSSDELLDCLRLERDILRRITPEVPATTNFTSALAKPLNYFRWAPEVDIVASDHYLRPAQGPTAPDLAMAGDVTRGLAGGGPWFLMEHSTGAVNWQPQNVPKQAGEMGRNTIAHIARGSDAAMFFQWRASRSGAEKYHSAMVPHAGTGTRVWREVVELGQAVQRLGEVQGSRVVADVGIIWDYEAWWAVELDSHPSVEVRYLERMRAFHTTLWEASVTTDFVGVGQDLSRYRLVIVPSLYAITDEHASLISRWVHDGGHLVVSYFSGIVDEHDAVRLGGYPGAFRDLLGITVEEFHPLPAGDTVALDDGSHADRWIEDLQLDGAQAITRYVDGPLAGTPAVTRRTYGRGVAWYVATHLDHAATQRLAQEWCREARVAPVLEALPPRMEAVRRRGVTHDYLFLINHSSEPARIGARGYDLLTGTHHGDQVDIDGGGVVVLRQEQVEAAGDGKHHI